MIQIRGSDLMQIVFDRNLRRTYVELTFIIDAVDVVALI